MHTTDTIDFEVVLDGEVWLELDDGVEVHLRAGDTVVQNGTPPRLAQPRRHDGPPRRVPRRRPLLTSTALTRSGRPLRSPHLFTSHSREYALMFVGDRLVISFANSVPTDVARSMIAYEDGPHPCTDAGEERGRVR